MAAISNFIRGEVDAFSDIFNKISLIVENVTECIDFTANDIADGGHVSLDYYFEFL